MEGRREDVETSPSPFSSAILCLKFGHCLVYVTAPKWTVCIYKFPGIDVNLAFLRDVFFF